MNKKAIFIFILIIILCAIIYIGYTIQRGNKQEEIIRNDMIFNKEENVVKNEVIETIMQEEKTTPNTMLILKKYYTDCGHEIEGKATMPEEMVNLTENDIKEKYPNWEIEKFNNEEVILKRVLESFCGEHYYVVEENGYISVYTVDEMENKTLKETGKISCEYLPETDRINLKNGIMIYGTQKLNQMLEDYE